MAPVTEAANSSPGPQLSSPELAADSRGPGVDPPQNDARLGVGIPSGAPPATIAAWPPQEWGPRVYVIDTSGNRA